MNTLKEFGLWGVTVAAAIFAAVSLSAQNLTEEHSSKSTLTVQSFYAQF
jgi:hypothetical protein